MTPSDKHSIFRSIIALWDPVHLQLWLDRHREERGLRAFAIRHLAIFLLTFRRLRDDEISRRAAALTYYTLLALVPVLAVAFALFKAFGGLRKVEAPLKQFVLENIAVGRADDIGGWLDSFINNINAGAIAGVSLLILFYSATGLLTNVEKSFNRIWGIERLRPLPIRFAIYWCLLTLAPPLFGVSLSLSAQLRTSAFAAWAVQWLPFGLGRWLLSLIANISISAAFVLAYIIVPNTRVRLSAALMGGIVAGLLWSATKALFIVLSASSAKYSAIYGALSALPLLILWMYYSWLITLFGVTYTFATQTIATQKLSAPSLRTTPAFRERLATRITYEVAAAYHRADTPPTAEELANRVEVMLTVVQPLLDVLVEHGVLLEAHRKNDTSYVPARELTQLSLEHVVEVLRNRDGTELQMTESSDSAPALALLEKARCASSDVLGTHPMVELLERSTPEAKA